MLTDTQQILNSISNNLISQNPEDLKNAVVSCRTLLIDIADKLNPASTPEDKPKYINRLKDYVSPKEGGDTKTKMVRTYLEEVKNRIEYTSDITQGKAHQDRPLKHEAEDIVLYTYLIIADLLEIYNQRNPGAAKPTETVGINKTAQEVGA